MNKFYADLNAVKIAEVILSTEPSAITGSSGGKENAAIAVADFIKTLSERLSSDLDDRLDKVIVGK